MRWPARPTLRRRLRRWAKCARYGPSRSGSGGLDLRKLQAPDLDLVADPQHTDREPL